MVHQLCCLPKIHKEEMLLHPIVDYTGSMEYKTSKAIADLLKPLVGKTMYHVKKMPDLRKDISVTCVLEMMRL